MTEKNEQPLLCHYAVYLLQKNISDALLVVLKNTQSALLILKDANEGPTIIQQANIGVLVNR